jgi:hypothetical protein
MPVSHQPSGSILHFSFEASATHQPFIFLLILLLMPNLVKSHAKVEKLSKMQGSKVPGDALRNRC